MSTVARPAPLATRRRVFAVVGPSGAGKDTLLAAALAERPEIHRVRRVITRPSEAGGEDFEGASEADFARRRAEGAFALHWQAHGLSYALPWREFPQDRDVVFNGSRRMLRPAADVFPTLRVILVTAPVEVLAERLAARGRESRDDIAARLRRAADMALPAGIPVDVIDNGGDLTAAVAAMLRVFRANTPAS